MTKYDIASGVLLIIACIACILTFWTPLITLGGLLGVFVIIACPINAVLNYRHYKRKAKTNVYH